MGSFVDPLVYLMTSEEPMNKPSDIPSIEVLEKDFEQKFAYPGGKEFDIIRIGHFFHCWGLLE